MADRLGLHIGMGCAQPFVDNARPWVSLPRHGLVRRALTGRALVAKHSHEIANRVARRGRTDRTVVPAFGTCFADRLRAAERRRGLTVRDGRRSVGRAAMTLASQRRRSV